MSRRGKRFIYGGIAVAFLVSAVLTVQKVVFQVDRYRPSVVAAIEDATGLPVTISSLELELFPVPRLQAHFVQIGEGSFSLSARRVTIPARLRPLSQGRVEVTSARIDGLTVHIPKSVKTLAERIDALAEHLGAIPDDEDSVLTITIDAISAPSALLVLDEDLEPLTQFSIEVENILSEADKGMVSAEIERVLDRDGATGELNFSFNTEDGKTVLEGGGILNGEALAGLVAALIDQETRFDAGPNAKIVAEGVRVSFGGEENPRLERGKVSFSNLNATSKNGESIISSASGDVALEGDLITIAHFSSDELTMSGKIEIDFKENQYELNLAELRYGRGELSDVVATVTVSSEAIDIHNASAHSATGNISGTAQIGRGEDRLLTADFHFDRIDGSLFDEMFFDEARGFHGLFSGDVELAAPIADPKAMIASTTGTVSWNAVDGSFGKLGFATKLLAALKTVDMINLRVPSFRDEGLTYDTFDGSLEFADGTMALADVVLDGHAYEIEATGQVDFKADESDIDVYIQVLESVSNVVEKVPVLGKATTRITTDLVGVNVHMDGSPYDLQTKVVPLGGKGLVGTTANVGKKTLKGVGKAFKKLFPGRKKSEAETGDNAEAEKESETP